MYTAHPSSHLTELFCSKPYQGANPNEAKFLFIGLDANYCEKVENTPIFPNLLEYHEDGVAFWRKHHVHHPFLLNGYRGDGQFYHRSFSLAGFKPEHAHQVSFVELLDLPTVGRSKLVPSDLNIQHLKALNKMILEGAAQHIFMPRAVATLMRATGLFSWLPRESIESHGPLNILHRQGNKTVYGHLHFSVWGKFNDRKLAEGKAIHALIES